MVIVTCWKILMLHNIHRYSLKLEKHKVRRSLKFCSLSNEPLIDRNFSAEMNFSYPTFSGGGVTKYSTGFFFCSDNFGRSI